MQRIPHKYLEPLGLPLYYRNEQSGELMAAVRAFLEESVEGKPATRAQLALVIEYIDYYLDAPCWYFLGGQLATLQDMCKQAARQPTAKKIQNIIYECLEIGLDPL